MLAAGSWQHVAVTLNGSTAILYVNGAQAASASVTITPSAFSPTRNYLGKSQFSADPLFNGKLDEVEIADYAMTPAQIAVLYNSTQNPNFISGVWTNNASGNWGTSNNWSGGSVANGISRIADFSTINITGQSNGDARQRPHHRRIEIRQPQWLQNWTFIGSQHADARCRWRKHAGDCRESKHRDDFHADGRQLRFHQNRRRHVDIERHEQRWRWFDG